MIWVLFLVALLISLIFLVIGISSGKKIYYAISFILFISIGIYILGTGLDLPTGIFVG